MYDPGFARDAAQCEQGTANETRHIFGARIWRHVLAYNAGAMFQAGRFGSQAVQLPIKELRWPNRTPFTSSASKIILLFVKD